MTVSDTTARTSATGNGAIGQDVPFTFPINTSDDLTVIERVTATGAETTLTETTNYTVDIDGDSGGTVTTVTAVEATSTIHAIRSTTATQALDLASGGSFDAETIEEGFDKLTRIVTELKDDVGRCIILPDTESASLFDLTLPSSVLRTSGVLGFDATGALSIITSFLPDDAVVSGFGETLIAAADADAAKTLLSITDVTLDTDGTFAANSDDVVPSQKAAKTYIDTKDALKLSLTGGTMSGAIAMGTSKITGMGDPAAAQDAATKAYVDAKKIVGDVVQVANSFSQTKMYTTTHMDSDDSIPQISEGMNVFTVAITPTSDTNELMIQVIISASSSASDYITVALFQDGGANAISCTAISTHAVNVLGTLTLTHYMTAGTTDEITFNVRAGADNSNLTVNGKSNAQWYGGVIASSVTIMEIQT